jgi:hypothetical protein
MEAEIKRLSRYEKEIFLVQKTAGNWRIALGGT